MADPEAPNLTNFGTSFGVAAIGNEDASNDSSDDEYDGRYLTKINETKENFIDQVQWDSNPPRMKHGQGGNAAIGRCVTILEESESESIKKQCREDCTLFVILCPDRSDEETISQIPDYDHLYPEDQRSDIIFSLTDIPEHNDDDKAENDYDFENKELTSIEDAIMSRLSLLRTEESRSLFEPLVDVENIDDLNTNLNISDSPMQSKHTHSTQGTTVSCSHSAISSFSRDGYVRAQKSSTEIELPCLYKTDATITQSQNLLLRQEGFPLGLVEQLELARVHFPVRYWVVDNSGSMRTFDGHQIRTVESSIKSRPATNTIITKCSRWDEIQNTISDHAELAGLLQMPTIFRFLHDPDGVGNQECSVAYSTVKSGLDYGYNDVKEVNRIVQAIKPQGATPLTSHLVEFRRRIEAIQQVLHEGSRAAVVVVVTDGLPTDDDGVPSCLAQHEFLESIRSLHTLAASVVIRLCTADEDVISFFHELDMDVDVRVDVLNDFLTESRQVNQINNWLNYALPLHRCRELGLHHKLFDILDERLLTKDELLEFLTLLFGVKQFRNAPNIHTQWKGFKTFLKDIVESEKKHWSPITKKMESWIDMSSLEKMYGTSRQFPWSGAKPKSKIEGVQRLQKADSFKQKGRRYFPGLWKSKQSSSPPAVVDERVDVQIFKRKSVGTFVELTGSYQKGNHPVSTNIYH